MCEKRTAEHHLQTVLPQATYKANSRLNRSRTSLRSVQVNPVLSLKVIPKCNERKLTYTLVLSLVHHLFFFSTAPFYTELAHYVESRTPSSVSQLQFHSHPIKTLQDKQYALRTGITALRHSSVSKFSKEKLTKSYIHCKTPSYWRIFRAHQVKGTGSSL